MSKKLDVTPYKGVRDFYPENMALLKNIFSVWRNVVESYGYEEYGSSPLEPSDLYKEKSGEEIVNEQTYSFNDRGGREVTLRPEMTPTIARMVAQRKRDLAFPLRWFSIANVFRYEQPQKGRLREHYQLNVDVFGLSGIEAEIELFKTIRDIFENFGATQSMYEIKINSIDILNDLFDTFEIPEENRMKVSKILDKKSKIDKGVFEESLETVAGKKAPQFVETLTKNQLVIEAIGEEKESIKKLFEFIEKLKEEGIENIVFTPTLTRGMDYYDGIIFEVFDRNKENRRSIFGGGRYNNLLDMFGGDRVPAVGYGLGDVTFRDFLESNNLLPKYSPTTKLYICRTEGADEKQISKITDTLRKAGVKVAVDYSNKKIGDQIKTADKHKIPFIICVGQNEIESQRFSLKKLETGEENEISLEEIASIVNKK